MAPGVATWLPELPHGRPVSSKLIIISISYIVVPEGSVLWKINFNLNSV